MLKVGQGKCIFLLVLLNYSAAIYAIDILLSRMEFEVMFYNEIKEKKKRKYFFTYRVINLWNSLPHDVDAGQIYGRKLTSHGECIQAPGF